MVMQWVRIDHWVVNHDDWTFMTILTPILVINQYIIYINSVLGTVLDSFKIIHDELPTLKPYKFQFYFLNPKDSFVLSQEDSSA